MGSEFLGQGFKSITGHLGNLSQLLGRLWFGGVTFRAIVLGGGVTVGGSRGSLVGVGGNPGEEIPALPGEHLSLPQCPGNTDTQELRAGEPLSRGHNVQEPGAFGVNEKADELFLSGPQVGRELCILQGKRSAAGHSVHLIGNASEGSPASFTHSNQSAW